MYVTRAMAEALMGAPLAGLTRGAPGKTIHGSLKWDDVPAPGRNVVAILPGSDPKLKGQYVAIGAHNDHVGFNHAARGSRFAAGVQHRRAPAGRRRSRLDRRRPKRTRGFASILDSLRKLHKPRLDSIYNGADDDGSGSVALLEIAEAFAKSTASRSVDRSSSGTRARRKGCRARSTSPIIRRCRAIRSSRSSTWT